ncbi:MAG: hypothetical protein NTW04_04500 [Elusimicrobia bacterium]|nr:hypothetical protein [Elusimicrobiota bacterium]
MSLKVAPKLKETLSRHESLVKKETEQVFQKYAPIICADVIRSISKTGRGAGRKYISSKPGEPPRLKSGRLRSSIGFRIIDMGFGQLRLEIGSLQDGGVLYAAILEEGGARVLPRPYIKPGVMRHFEQMRQEIEDRLSEIL